MSHWLEARANPTINHVCLLSTNKVNDKIALTVFSMTVNLDITIKIVSEDALEGQHTAVTNRRVSQDTSYFLLACQLLTHWTLSWRHKNAEHFGNEHRMRQCLRAALQRAAGSVCILHREALWISPVCQQSPYRQHCTEQGLLAGIFSEKKVGIKLDFEMLLNISINNWWKLIFAVHRFYYKHID